MACKTCGQAGSNCGCDTSCFGGTANWLVPVKVAPPIEMASRKFAYITPDQTVWVANFDGTEMIPLGGEDIDWIVDADEALPPLEEANPLRIYRQDDKMFIVNEAKTDWIDLTESSSFEQVQADWNVTDETSKAFIKNKPTIIPADFEKTKLVTETTITATSPVVTLNSGAMKTELVVNSLETELRSGTVYIHNLTADIGDASIGNGLGFSVAVPIPNGMTIPSDRLPLIAVSDTGGTTHATGFADFKTETGVVTVTESAVTITGNFYASANYPSNTTAFNFRDVIIKFV